MDRSILPTYESRDALTPLISKTFGWFFAAVADVESAEQMQSVMQIKSPRVLRRFFCMEMFLLCMPDL